MYELSWILITLGLLCEVEKLIPCDSIANNIAHRFPFFQIQTGRHEFGNVSCVAKDHGRVAGPGDRGSAMGDVEHQGLGAHVGLDSRRAPVVHEKAVQEDGSLQIRRLSQHFLSLTLGAHGMELLDMPARVSGYLVSAPASDECG